MRVVYIFDLNASMVHWWKKRSASIKIHDIYGIYVFYIDGMFVVSLVYIRG